MDRTTFVTDGDMETGLALVRLFTERWGAEVVDYDATPEGDVVVNLTIPTDSKGMLQDQRRALIRQNRRHIMLLRERMDAVDGFIFQTWRAHSGHGLRSGRIARTAGTTRPLRMAS